MSPLGLTAQRVSTAQDPDLYTLCHSRQLSCKFAIAGHYLLVFCFQIWHPERPGPVSASCLLYDMWCFLVSLMCRSSSGTIETIVQVCSIYSFCSQVVLQCYTIWSCIDCGPQWHWCECLALCWEPIGILYCRTSHCLALSHITVVLVTVRRLMTMWVLLDNLMLTSGIWAVHLFHHSCERCCREMEQTK